jgi:hypothetical protein
MTIFYREITLDVRRRRVWGGVCGRYAVVIAIVYEIIMDVDDVLDCSQ